MNNDYNINSIDKKVMMNDDDDDSFIIHSFYVFGTRRRGFARLNDESNESKKSIFDC